MLECELNMFVFYIFFLERFCWINVLAMENASVPMILPAIPQLSSRGCPHVFVSVFPTVFPTVFPWFSHGFPIETSIFLWFSYGFPMKTSIFLWFSHGFCSIFPWPKRPKSPGVDRCFRARGCQPDPVRLAAASQAQKCLIKIYRYDIRHLDIYIYIYIMLIWNIMYIWT